MTFWNRCVWWIAAFVAVACLLALAQTAQTGSRPVASGSQPGPDYFTLREEGQPGVAYGVTEDGRTVIYSRSPSDH